MARPHRNKTLLRRIANKIEQEPKCHSQTCWLETKRYHPIGVSEIPETPECGTVGCIAGWAVALSTKERREASGKSKYRDVAKFLLRLNNTEAEDLFRAGWRPRRLTDTVPQALRRIADGEKI